MSNQSLITRRSLAIYFLLAFGIAWIGSFISVGPRFLAGEAIEFSDGGIMALSMLGAPFTAGILMTYLTEGKPGLSELFAGVKKYQVGGRWYLPLLIFPTLLLLVAVLLSVLVDPEMAPTFVLLGLLSGPLAGVLEETGWTGFAYPRLSKKTSALSAAISLGVIHGIWHFLVWYLSQSGDLGMYWWPYFFGFCLHVVALRVLLVWVFENTGSLLLAMLMHASSTGFFVILIPTTLAPVNWVIYYNVYGVVLCTAAALVAIKYGKTLRGKSFGFTQRSTQPVL